MKIAIISSVLPYHGGMGRVLDFEARELKKRKIDFKVFVPDYGKRIETNYDIEYLKPNFKIGFGALCFDLIKKINSEEFDIIYLHYPAYGLAELLLSKKIKQKIIIRYHMDVVGGDIFRKIFFVLHNKFIMPKILAKANKIIFSTKDYAENSVAEKYFLRSENINKLIEIPFGVDLEKFNLDNNIEKQNQILFVSKLDKQHYFKGLENLIKAFSNIDNKNNVVLKVIGNGDMLDYYKNIVKELNIENKINFNENVSDEELKNEYQKSICTILPSIDKGEAFGLVLIESFACGTPVIASNLPGVRSVVSDNGFLCDVNNINSLKEQLEKILEIYFNEKDNYINIKNNCINSIREKYNWDNVVNELLKYFN